MSSRRVLAAATIACAGSLITAGGGLADPQDGVLPDLVADPSANLHLQRYDDHGVKRLLLRFNGYIPNVTRAPPGAAGAPTAGSLDIRGARPTIHDPMSVEQLVHAPDGSVAQRITGTGARLRFATADGHDHWHLMHAARYSLWLSDRSGEAAPAQKVGFCLDDAERMSGTAPAFFDDAHGRRFCMRHHPGALSLFEGIQPGWRDVYVDTLTYQWVDASDVAPGRYRLRTDVDPDGVIVEADEVNAPAFTRNDTVVPGWVSRPGALRVGSGRTSVLRLAARDYGHPGPVRFRIVAAPRHGRLSVRRGPAFATASVAYTPRPGFRGTDRFTYVALDRASPFPRTPPVATVALSVDSGGAAVAIGGLPASMRAGTSVRLRAVAPGGARVTWTASAGRVSASGLYRAPAAAPAGGTARIEARTAAGASDVRTIRIRRADPVGSPAPAPPAAAGARDAASGALRAFAVGRVAGRIVLSAVPARTGVIRLGAYDGRRLIGACRGRAARGESFACRLPAATGGARIARLDAVSARASLRVGGRVVAHVRASGRYARGLSGLRLVCELPPR